MLISLTSPRRGGTPGEPAQRGGYGPDVTRKEKLIVRRSSGRMLPKHRPTHAPGEGEVMRAGTNTRSHRGSASHGHVNDRQRREGADDSPSDPTQSAHERRTCESLADGPCPRLSQGGRRTISVTASSSSSGNPTPSSPCPTRRRGPPNNPASTRTPGPLDRPAVGGPSGTGSWCDNSRSRETWPTARRLDPDTPRPWRATAFWRAARRLGWPQVWADRAAHLPRSRTSASRSIPTRTRVTGKRG